MARNGEESETEIWSQISVSVGDWGAQWRAMARNGEVEFAIKLNIDLAWWRFRRIGPTIGGKHVPRQIVLKLSENDAGNGHGVTNSAPNVRCCPNPQEHGPPLRVSKRSSQTQPLGD